MIVNDFKSPEILEDQSGNLLGDGNIVFGPNTGEKFDPINSFRGMFFSWTSFYRVSEID